MNIEDNDYECDEGMTVKNRTVAFVPGGDVDVVAAENEVRHVGLVWRSGSLSRARTRGFLAPSFLSVRLRTAAPRALEGLVVHSCCR